MTASQIHSRSISLPSRLHPITNSTEFESELQKLNSCLSKNVLITSQTIQSGLFSLAELYNSVDDKLTQNHQDGKLIKDSLESSVQLLDSCNTIRELVQMIKENARALQSALRRKGTTLNPAMQNDVDSYLCFRKKTNKWVAKSLKTLENLLENKNNNGSNIVSLTDPVTIAILKSTLVFLSWQQPAGKSSGGWNLVYRRLMITKSVDRDNIGVVSEVGCVDSVLNALRNGDSKAVDLQMVQRSLQNLDVCIEAIETGLQELFRQLLQCRVRLLNIVTHHLGFFGTI